MGCRVGGWSQPGTGCPPPQPKPPAPLCMSVRTLARALLQDPAEVAHWASHPRKLFLCSESHDPNCDLRRRPDSFLRIQGAPGLSAQVPAYADRPALGLELCHVPSQCDAVAGVLPSLSAVLTHSGSVTPGPLRHHRPGDLGSHGDFALQPDRLLENGFPRTEAVSHLRLM